jgi:UDP-N-acetylmuramoyl-tripeptide--D-alanyl-D-alanine ligase
MGRIATVTGGVLVGDDAEVAGVSIDSRTVAPGEMFVAIRAERDGHSFVAAAAEAGAGGLLVEREDPATGLPQVVVGDTSAALIEMGRAARARLTGPVVGITGSVGKTSTKDLAAAAAGVDRILVASPRSFNNELGVPLTLTNAPADAQVAVLEMGARGPGHIAHLCRIASPTIGVVTAVAAAHLEMFGDLEGVARTKGELVEALPASGTAVLNGDDHRVRAMASRGSASALFYSTGRSEAPADLVATGLELDDRLRPAFTAGTPWGTVRVRLGARGAHQVGNALAALAVAALVGVPLEAAAAAMGDAPLSAQRMEVLTAPSGTTVIDDSYNANPESMAAALRALAALPSSRRSAVLGPMAELGADAAGDHRRVADLARSLGIEVIAVGTPDYGIDPLPLDGVDAVLEALGGRLGGDCAVLVKASRVARLERVVQALMEA